MCVCVCDSNFGKMHMCVRCVCGRKSSVRMCVRARQKIVATDRLKNVLLTYCHRLISNVWAILLTILETLALLAYWIYLFFLEKKVHLTQQTCWHQRQAFRDGNLKENPYLEKRFFFQKKLRWKKKNVHKKFFGQRIIVSDARSCWNLFSSF